MPAVPAITVTILSGGASVAMTGATPGSTNIVYKQRWPGGAWSSAGAITGHLDLSLTPADYVLCVRSSAGGSTVVSNISFVHIAAAGSAEAFYRVVGVRHTGIGPKKELVLQRMERPVFPVL
jgi:hypothetical protein